MKFTHYQPGRAKKFKGLEISDCPFVNLPEKTPGRWGQVLTKAKMVDCRWLKPMLVGQFEFTEWSGENLLRIRDSSRCEKTRKQKTLRGSAIEQIAVWL